MDGKATVELVLYIALIVPVFIAWIYLPRKIRVGVPVVPCSAEKLPEWRAAKLQFWASAFNMGGVAAGILLIFNGFQIPGTVYVAASIVLYLILRRSALDQDLEAIILRRDIQHGVGGVPPIPARVDFRGEITF